MKKCSNCGKETDGHMFVIKASGKWKPACGKECALALCDVRSEEVIIPCGKNELRRNEGRGLAKDVSECIGMCVHSVK